MDITTPPNNHRIHAYGEMYEQYVIDASFLWVLRSIAVNQANYTLEDVAEIERRIDDQLDGLIASIEPGWAACEAALEQQGPGEVFTAMVTALRSHEMNKLRHVVEVGLANEQAANGLISALGWVQDELARPWIDKFLSGKDMQHKFLGIAACSVRRQDPGELLTTIMHREDCRAHATLHARALRLIGELRRQDLMPALLAAQASSNDDIRFWSVWSAILLGNNVAVRAMQPFVFKPGPHQHHAIQLAFRVLPIEQAREWISTLVKDNGAARAVIKATGVLGDPHAVNWLIGKMPDPALARVAGEAFTSITGVDMEKHQLNGLPPAGLPLIPNDDTDDTDVAMDEDEHLLWPNVEKVTALWRNHGQHFRVGQRYFLGKPITLDVLKQKLSSADQRQRRAAALELALIDPQTRLINTSAKVAT